MTVVCWRYSPGHSEAKCRNFKQECTIFGALISMGSEMMARLFCVFLLFLCACGEERRPPVWQFGQHFLVGTVHDAREGTNWSLPTEIKSLRDLDAIYYESQLSEEEAQQALDEFDAACWLTADDRLRLWREEKALKHAAIKSGLLKSWVTRSHPECVALRFGFKNLNRAGAFFDYGLEAFLEQYAEDRGIDNRPLGDPLGQQLVYNTANPIYGFPYLHAFHAGEMDEDVIVKQLDEGYLQDESNIKNDLIKLEENFPVFYETLFTKRNIHFTSRIIEEIKSDGCDRCVFALGAAHFVGPDSILVMLKDQGYELQRIQ